MKLKTEFESYINKIVNELREKGVDIIVANIDRFFSRSLYVQVDLSVPMFFSEHFGPELHDRLISALYEKLGTEHCYTINDDIYVTTKYMREKLPVIGEEVEYIRIFFKFIIGQC